MRKKKRKVWVAVVVPLARVLYKAMRWDARKKRKETEKRPRTKGQTGKERTGKKVAKATGHRH